MTNIDLRMIASGDPVASYLLTAFLQPKSIASSTVDCCARQCSPSAKTVGTKSLLISLHLAVLCALHNRTVGKASAPAGSGLAQ